MPLNPEDPDQIVAADIDWDGKDELVVSFVGYGLYIYQPANKVWQRINTLIPDRILPVDIDRDLNDELVISFPGYGLYTFEPAGGVWQPINTVIPDNMIRLNNGIVCDFGAAYGLWTWTLNGGWIPRNSVDPLQMLSVDIDKDGVEELVVSFSGYGLYFYDETTGWQPLNDVVPEEIISINFRPQECASHGQDSLPHFPKHPVTMPRAECANLVNTDKLGKDCSQKEKLMRISCSVSCAMNERPDFISIIIPGYNEEKRVARSLKALGLFCEDHFERYEIVFVNDGSTDKTGEIVESLTNPFLRAIHLHTNQGKGYAVRRGMLEARGDYRFFTDADLPYAPEAFLQAINLFHSTPCDWIAGARDFPGSSDRADQTLFRKLTSKGFSALVHFLLKLEVNDTQCGFKGFTASAAKKIFSLSSVKGYAFDVELFLLGRAARLKVGKIPVRLVERRHSKVRLSLDAPKMFWDVMKLYRWRMAHGARGTEEPQLPPARE